MKATRNQTRQLRHHRTRRKILGTAERPRLNVFRSNEQIYAQLINDVLGHTMVSASTLSKELPVTDKKPVEKAFEVGKLIAERAQAAGVSAVVFDRGGYAYRGQIASLAAGAREGGLQF